MTPERWEKVGEIFNSASELPAAEREEFLNDACGGDNSLRAEVESLLAAGTEAGNFISEPVAGKFVPDLAEHIRALSPGNSVGHYRIERAIGSGGMGEVYLAADTKLNRLVALKTLPPSFASDPNFLRRFTNEAQAAANLNHPNVATVYSVEEIDGLPFITMEFVDGQTLDHLTPDEGLDIGKFLEWFDPIADALAHAHEKGVIHRDIKPGNIMISLGGTPKILDFGLAQVERSLTSLEKTDITAPGQIIGTPSYMSPEQAEGSNVDQRSDIFSFGTVMYEALTGKRPFRGASQGLIVRSVIDSEPEPVSRLKPGVPSVLAKMVSKCLRKLPGSRFQTMREVRSILKEAKAASDAGVSMDSFARRFYREATSPSKLWWAAASVLVIFLGFASWYFFSASADQPPFSFDKITMRQLSQSNNIAFAAIAPDGRSIVYVTYEDTGDRALWLRRVSDSNAIQIVPPQPVLYWDCPTFSNDGEYIYFITAGRSATHGTMYRVPSLGGQPRKLIEKVNHLGSLSPDGSRILFVRYGDIDPNSSVNATETTLLSANASDGTDEQAFRKVEGETIIREPRYAADGRSIFYSKRELTDDIEFWSIMMLDPASGRETEILRQRERISEVAVLQMTDGLLMNAADPVSNRRQLFHVSVPDGKVTRITNDINSYVGVSVDREGRNIVSAQRSEENRIWIGAAGDFNSLKPVTREPLAHHNVEWTPDGRIVYDVYENSRLTILIADADGRNALKLTPPDSDNSEPRVSGDGKYIVFTSRRSGFNEIWRMNIDGSNPVRLADVPGISQFPRFEADGKTVVFRWFSEGSAPLGTVSVEGGPVTGIEGLPPSIVYYWAPSPDGKFVAFTTTDSATARMHVVIRPVGSDVPMATLDIWPSRIFKWMPDGKNLFYQERQRGENLLTKVFQIDPQRPEPKLLLSTEPDDVYDLTFSRDGKSVAVVRGKTSSDAVMLSTAEEPSRVR